MSEPDRRSDRVVSTAMFSSRRSRTYVTRAEMLEILQSDESFVDEVVAMFLRRFPILLDEIRCGFEASDVAAISRAALSLAGSIAYFDEGETCEAAKRVERIRASELTRIPAALSELEQRLDDLSHYLSGEFSQRRAAPAARRSYASGQM